MELIFEKTHRGRTPNYFSDELPAGVKAAEQVIPSGLLRKNAPGLFETLEVLGQETTLSRIGNAIQLLA